MHLKNLILDFGNRQNGRKVQNGVKNQCFRIFVPKSTIFIRFQKSFLHSKRLFTIQLLWKKLFWKNLKWLIGSRWRHFRAKIDFFSRRLAHSTPTVFQIPKKPKCSAKIQETPKKFAKKNFQRWRRFSRWRLHFFAIWNWALWAFYLVYRANFWAVSIFLCGKYLKYKI